MNFGQMRGLMVALSMLVAPAGWAQELPTEDVDLTGVQTGWHTVRPGENLIRITAKYLGTTARWRDNWKLNPDIQNPHVIQPGTRIRVILQFETAPPIARLKALSGKVEARPVPIPWNDARVQDLLVERDGLRTHRNSSTELEFQDGTDLVLSEESLVFVRPSSRTVTGPVQRSVEIVEGQAELQAVRSEGPRTDVEIVVGPATARPKEAEDGRAQTRARKVEDGSARVMVYAGSSDVEAGGESVAVPQGMGTAVQEDEPPSPPEELLAPPGLLAPPPNRKLGFGNPWFAWTGVEGAASHTLELCRDAKCGELLERVEGIAGDRWQSESLPEGRIHWRITAVSASGLDGYPSESRVLEVLSGDADSVPPTGDIRIVGDSATAGDRTYYRSDARVEIAMRDGESGLASWTAMIDGREVDPSALAGPWSTGAHTVRGIGLDHSGNRGETDLLTFHVDADGPELRVETGDAELLRAKLGHEALPKWWTCRKKRWTKRNVRKAKGSPTWTILGSGSDGRVIAAIEPDDILTRKQLPDTSLAIEGDRPGALLFLAGMAELPEPASHESEGEAGSCAAPHGQVIWIDADDALIDIQRLSLDSASGPDSLEIQSEDALGNRRSLSVGLRPPSG